MLKATTKQVPRMSVVMMMAVESRRTGFDVRDEQEATDLPAETPDLPA
jgi:hypothetical protein